MVAKVKLTVSQRDLKVAENEILFAADKLIKSAIDKMDKVLFTEARRLAEKIRGSSEFQALKTPTLIGQFGFTPAEVSRLDSLIPLIGPNRSNNITKVIKNVARRRVEFAWVDLDALKEHEIARHELTRIDPRTRREIPGQIVSWIEWWEDGVTVRGHIFARGNVEISRSRFGIMRTASGSFFALAPTRIFQKTGNEEAVRVNNTMISAFKLLVKKENS